MNTNRNLKYNTPTEKKISKRQQVLEILADGLFHSGEEIGETLGLTRAAIWKHIQSLQEEGLEIYSVRGRGYCLEQNIELLNSQLISQHLSKHALHELAHVNVLFDVDSTNSFLLRRLEKGSVHGEVVVSEYQSTGRGRRDSQWFSPRGAGLYFSIGWRFNEVLADMHCLSLSIGVAIVRALNQLGFNGVGLKWPNDIYFGLEKLGGVLVETRMENAAYAEVVVGVGINISLPSKIKQSIEQATCDLISINKEIPPRNKLIATLIDEITLTLKTFQSKGFQNDIEQWRKLDVAKEKKVMLQLDNQSNIGRVLGIEDNGMLKLSVNGVIKKFMSGQISFKIDQ